MLQDSPVGRKELDVNIVLDSSLQMQRDGGQRLQIQSYRQKNVANNSEMEGMHPSQYNNMNNSPDLSPFKSDIEMQSA